MSFIPTRHSPIWITNDSIHCSLPSNYQNLQKVGYDIVVFNCNMLAHAWHTWCKNGTNGKRMSCSSLIGHMQIFKLMDFRTMGLWIWITFFFDTHCISTGLLKTKSMSMSLFIFFFTFFINEGWFKCMLNSQGYESSDFKMISDFFALHKTPFSDLMQFACIEKHIFSLRHFRLFQTFSHRRSHILEFS